MTNDPWSKPDPWANIIPASLAFIDPWNKPAVNPPVGTAVVDEVKTTVIFEPKSELGVKLIAIEEEKDGKRIVSGNHTHMDKRLLVFECECGEELNPNTTRFSELCNVASEKDWVVEWSHNGYKPYCPKCALEQGKGND